MRAVTPVKTIQLHPHLLTLEALVESQHQHHRIGLCGYCLCLCQQIPRRRCPHKACRRIAVKIFVAHFQRVFFSPLQENCPRIEGRVMLIGTPGAQAVPQRKIHIRLSPFAKVVYARDRRQQVARPAHTIVARTQLRMRWVDIPGKIQLSVRSRPQRRSTPFRIGKVLSLQALPALRCEQVYSGHRLHGGQPVGQHTALRIQYFRLGRQFIAQALQHRHGRTRDTIVIAPQRLWVIGIGPDDRQPAQVFGKRQQAAIILQQHDTFAGRAASQRAMRGAVNDGKRDIGISDPLRRVEHAQSEACREQAAQRAVDGSLCGQAARQCLPQALITAATLQIAARLNGKGSCRGIIGQYFVKLPDIRYGPAVRNHVTFKSPLPAQYVKQQRTGAGRLAAQAVVGTHHRIHFGLLDQRAECRQIGLPQIPLARLRVKGMPAGLRP